VYGNLFRILADDMARARVAQGAVAPRTLKSYLTRRERKIAKKKKKDD
jgi:hypothetical protein